MPFKYYITKNKSLYMILSIVLLGIYSTNCNNIALSGQNQGKKSIYILFKPNRRTYCVNKPRACLNNILRHKVFQADVIKNL